MIIKSFEIWIMLPISWHISSLAIAKVVIVKVTFFDFFLNNNELFILVIIMIKHKLDWSLNIRWGGGVFSWEISLLALVNNVKRGDGSSVARASTAANFLVQLDLLEVQFIAMCHIRRFIKVFHFIWRPDSLLIQIGVLFTSKSTTTASCRSSHNVIIVLILMHMIILVLNILCKLLFLLIVKNLGLSSCCGSSIILNIAFCCRATSTTTLFLQLVDCWRLIFISEYWLKHLSVGSWWLLLRVQWV